MDRNKNRNRNRNRNKKQVINIDRLEKASLDIEEESIGDENNINTIEKTPFQKIVLYVYLVIVLGLLLIGGYILYKYMFKTNFTSNKQGGFNTRIDKLPEMDRKSISELLDKFID